MYDDDAWWEKEGQSEDDSWLASTALGKKDQQWAQNERENKSSGVPQPGF